MGKAKLNEIKVWLNIGIKFVSIPAIFGIWFLTSNVGLTVLLILVVYVSTLQGTVGV